jgi:hypothetical protein
LTPPSWRVSGTVAHSISLSYSTRSTPHSVSARRDSSTILLSAASPLPKKFVNAIAYRSRGPSSKAPVIHWLEISIPVTSSSQMVRSIVHSIVVPKLAAPVPTRTVQHVCARRTTFSIASLRMSYQQPLFRTAIILGVLALIAFALILWFALTHTAAVAPPVMAMPMSQVVQTPVSRVIQQPVSSTRFTPSCNLPDTKPIVSSYGGISRFLQDFVSILSI